MKDWKEVIALSIKNKEYDFLGGDKSLEQDLLRVPIKELLVDYCMRYSRLLKKYNEFYDKNEYNYHKVKDTHRKEAVKKNKLLRESWELFEEEYYRHLKERREREGRVSDAERNLVKNYNRVIEEIESLTRGAEDQITQAEALSKKWGIPFHSYVSPLAQKFVPASARDILGEDAAFIFGDLDPELHGLEFEYAYGWEHSDIC